MAAPSVVVLDYGSGNLRSVQKALEAVGAQTTVTADFASALNADGLLIPGVGAFDACMRGLRQVRADVLVYRRVAGGRAVMGICVGHQVMFQTGVEHGVITSGLGQWPGIVEEMHAPVLPHMGWNTVDAPQDSELFAGLHDQRFYFVHSYAVTTWELGQLDPNRTAPKVTWSEHGQRFVAAVENGPLVTTQFHPEKSGDAGLALLRTWVQSL